MFGQCRIAWVLALFAAGGSAARVQAQVFIDDFNRGNDSGWTRYDPLAAFGAPATFSFPQVGAGNFAYRIQAAPSPSPAQLGPARAGSYRPELSYTDPRLSVDVPAYNAALDQSFGLAFRLRQFGLGTTDGYALLYFPVGRELTFNRVDNESTTQIGTTAILPTNPAGLRLVLSATGTNLTGQVFDLANPAVPLATVTAVDATYTVGNIGILSTTAATAPGAGSDATFDNFGAQPVPEPGSLALTALAGVGVLAARRRRRASPPAGGATPTSGDGAPVRD